MKRFHALGLSAATALVTVHLCAQTPPPAQRPGPGDGFDGAPSFGQGGRIPGGPGGGPGFGGPGFGGPNSAERKVLSQFDRNGDKRLDAGERAAAREFLAADTRPGRGGPRGPRFGGPAGDAAAPSPGIRLAPSDVAPAGDAPLYDPDTVRTLFLDFESADWERELSDFYNTDVEVPARLTVDGQVLDEVGVHFRGASSYFTVGEGVKRSLNLALNEWRKDQRLGGYRTLNLLNSHTDPTFLRTVLALHISREYLPAPRANFVRVVINGENWGVYINAQQFNTDFTRDWFDSTQVARWKVPGSPRGNAGLTYLGEDPSPYRALYEIKSRNDEKSWTALIRLCRVLNQTPLDRLEAALEPLLDIDGTLRFLALENVLINADGYWVRASDYNLCQDTRGRFHLIPHDVNETFRAGGGGPGMGPRGPGFGGGGAGGGGIELDPLVGLDDPGKPLRSRLLAVPALQARYLGYVRDMAQHWLDWDRLGPLASELQGRIAEDVRIDTRKLDSYERFIGGLTDDEAGGDGGGGFRGPQRAMSLKTFADRRRAYLLSHPKVQTAPLPALRRPDKS
ncbi:MAG: CotH kinase family protein [Verrucomicrobiae bacterium]|nr:CotH kinase family protein [Verrucomicrobiae bacterium]